VLVTWLLTVAGLPGTAPKRKNAEAEPYRSHQTISDHDHSSHHR
jgi:hypothetical protein